MMRDAGMVTTASVGSVFPSSPPHSGKVPNKRDEPGDGPQCSRALVCQSVQAFLSDSGSLDKLAKFERSR